jgi:hypothetical protein
MARMKSEIENETRSAMAADLETEDHTPEEISKREPGPWRDLLQEQHQSLQNEIWVTNRRTSNKIRTKIK